MGRLVSIAGSILVAAVVHSGPASAQYKLKIDEKVARLDAWVVGYNRSTNGCLAKATYSDQSTLWLGVNGQSDSVYMALTNPGWQSIQEGKEYPIKIAAIGGGRWQGSFSGVVQDSEKGIIATGLKEKFVRDLIRSPGIAVSLGNKVIAKLNLAGSPSAFAAVFDCQATQANGPGPSASGPANARVVGNGTGFFISKQGHLLTNNHVVKECAAVEINQAGEPRRKVSVLATDTVNDLALLKATVTPAGVAALRRDVRVGETVAVYGFPLSDRLAATGNFTVGYVSALAGLGNDTSKIQLSAPIQPGNSGGPVFDKHGNVVAVIVSTATTGIVANASGVVPQNINFAIKSGIASGFLEANGVSASEPAETAKVYEPADLAERARLNTVKVLCER